MSIHSRVRLVAHRPRFAAALFALALLVAQGVALLHAIVHVPLQAAVVGTAEFDGPWGHAAGSADCQLLDQLLLGQAAGDPPAAQVAPISGAEAPAPAPVIGPCARLARPFEARAPPLA